MATTPNFGWQTPNDTDYVKDGASAIRTLGNAIDASMADLEGGTTGQVLSKNSNTDMDFTWVTPNDADAIQNTIVDAKGDIITATGADTPARLASSGVNGEVLQVDTSTATGLKWAAPAAGAVTLISRTSFSNVASQTFDNVFSTTYETYVIVIESIYAVTRGDDLYMQFRQGTTTLTSGNFVTCVASNGFTGASNAAQLTLQDTIGEVDWPSSGTIFVNNVGVSGRRAQLQGHTVQGYDVYQYIFGGENTTTTAATTGFLLKSSSTNITGTVAIYGLAKA